MTKKPGSLFCCLLLCACSDQFQVDKSVQINNPLEIKPNFRIVNYFPAASSGALPLVSINIPEIRIQFADELLANSITDDTVYLQSVAEPNDVHSDIPPPLLSPLEFNYDNRVLRIRLKNILSPATDYHLLINGVTTVRGDKLLGHVVPFRTRANPISTIVEYDKEVPKFRLVFENDALGVATQLLQYNAYDSITTEDDFLIGKTDFDKKLGQVQAHEINYDDSGNVTYYRADIWQGNAIMAHATFNSPGANQSWGDDDDEISTYTDSIHIQEQHRLNRFFVPDKASGVTPVWQNRDTAFKLDHAILSIYDKYNKITKKIVYKSLGQFNQIDTNALGVPTPMDDVIDFYTLYAYDTDDNPKNGIGLPTTSTTYAAPATSRVVDLKGPKGRDELIAYQTFNKDPDVPVRINQSINYIQSKIGFDPKEVTLHDFMLATDPANIYTRLNTQVFLGDTMIRQIFYDTEK